MNLFEFSKNTYTVTFTPETLTLKPFKDVIDADKTKNKEVAIKELAFIYFYTDIKSDYMYLVDDVVRMKELMNDLELPKSWKISDTLQKAISFYKERSTTVNSSLYKSACKAALDVSNYLNKTDTLLEERDENGKVVTDIAKITGALEKVPRIMANLNSAHTELVREQKITEGRTKGSKELNIFEDGV